MPHLATSEGDPNFLRHAIRNGEWERYEHPTKGDTLTLQIGQFPILSIHALMVDGPVRPTEEFMKELAQPETVALLLSKLARVQEQLRVATDIIASGMEGDEGEDHRWIIAYLGDEKRFSWVCSCGQRQDEIGDDVMAQSLAESHMLD